MQLIKSILAIAGSALLLWFVTSTYTSYKRLAHVPGPLLATTTPLWLAYHTLKGDLYLRMRDLFDKYGSPIRIAPNTICTADPTSIRNCTTPKSTWSRGDWFEGMKLDPKVDNILSIRNEAEHSLRRRQLTPGYQGADIPTLEADIDAQVLNFKAIIQEYATSGKTFDMATIAHYFFLDVLTKIAFGDALGYLTKQEDLFAYISTTEAFLPVLELSLNNKTVLDIMQSSIMQAAAPKTGDKSGLGAIMTHANNIIKQRYDTGEQKADMVGSFIKNGLTATQLQSELLILILAGTDSTSTAMRITLLHIMTNPLVYAKLQREIDAESASVTTPVITNAFAQNLPYLRAVILEGLRMCMPLQGLRGHKPPPGGAEMEGIWVPDGTEVGFAVYAMLYRKDLFGDDADTFNPERWLDDSPKIAEMEKNLNMVFGAGRTSCLGKGIAYMELRKGLFEIFRAFDVIIVNPINPVYIKSNGAVVMRDMTVRAYQRTEA